MRSHAAQATGKLKSVTTVKTPMTLPVDATFGDYLSTVVEPDKVTEVLASPPTVFVVAVGAAVVPRTELKSVDSGTAVMQLAVRCVCNGRGHLRAQTVLACCGGPPSDLSPNAACSRCSLIPSAWTAPVSAAARARASTAATMLRLMMPCWVWRSAQLTDTLRGSMPMLLLFKSETARSSFAAPSAYTTSQTSFALAVMQ